MKTRLMVCLSLLAALATGCPDNNNGNPGDPDMARPPAGDMAMLPPNYNLDMDCFENATTHNEIINSCAPGVERIDKNPVLPKLNPDGTRPPLP